MRHGPTDAKPSYPIHTAPGERTDSTGRDSGRLELPAHLRDRIARLGGLNLNCVDVTRRVLAVASVRPNHAVPDDDLNVVVPVVLVLQDLNGLLNRALGGCQGCTWCLVRLDRQYCCLGFLRPSRAPRCSLPLDKEPIQPQTSCRISSRGPDAVELPSRTSNVRALVVGIKHAS